MVIDRIGGRAATTMVRAGYPREPDDTVEGIRLDEVQECWMELRGIYPGQNAIHRLADADLARLSECQPIPPEVVAKRTSFPNGPVEARPDPAPRPAAPPALLAQPILTVDRLELTAYVARERRAFDAYVMVDWSSSSKPVTGNDSIWIARGIWEGRRFSAGAPVNVATRKAAVDQLRTQLLRWRDDGLRVLVGLDFAFGYPAGFARVLGLDASRGAWRAVHEHIAASVTDSPDNAHNRDAFA
jgi:hypothetical protein